jgi:hypothetical protein
MWPALCTAREGVLMSGDETPRAAEAGKGNPPNKSAITINQFQPA